MCGCSGVWMMVDMVGNYNNKYGGDDDPSSQYFEALLLLGLMKELEMSILRGINFLIS